jgi:hypothetical protein
MEITEELMYYVWNARQFDHQNLKTLDGEQFEIASYGNRNGASGPDFINAAISIAGLKWHGNIEMHVRTSDWKKHGHHNDEAYDNVILHVVWTHDTDPTGGKVPVFELSPLVNPGMLVQYQKLKTAATRLPCQALLDDSCFSQMLFWRDALATQRLERKMVTLAGRFLSEHSPDWDSLVYRLMVIYLCGKENRDCGEMLSQKLTLVMLDRNKEEPLDILALFLGTAGCIEDVTDAAFQTQLDQRFRHLAGKYDIVPIKNYAWRRFGMRASGMPVRRLAQAAFLFCSRSRYFDALIACKDMQALMHLFPHHLPEVKPWLRLLPSAELLTKQVKETLILNALLPVWFYYHHIIHKNEGSAIIFDMMDALPAEENACCGNFKKLGFQMRSALDSQAHLELWGEYCKVRRCAACRVGQQIFSKAQ